MYQSDLTDSQWQVIEVLLADKRKRKHSLRAILNAIVYLTKTGSQWRMLPNEFPKWQICYYYFQKWITDRTWIGLNSALVGRVRKKQGRDPSPSLGIIDSQSVKSSEWGVPDKGFDGNKKTQGRKRQIIIDILGLILSADVHAANQYDGNAAENVVQELFKRGYKRMKKLLADKGYHGELEESIKK